MAKVEAQGTQAMHDLLVKLLPAGAEHPRDTCPWCTARSSEPEGDMGDTFTAEQLQAEIERQTAPLKAELARLQSAQTQEAQRAAIAAAVEEAEGPLKARIGELEGDVDRLTIEARTATENHDQLLAWLDEQKVEQEKAALRESRKDERVKAVKEALPVLTDEDVSTRVERWAEMDDDAFVAHLEELKTVAAAVGAGGGSNRPPATTAMTASAGSDGRSGAGHATSRTGGLGTLLQASRENKIDLGD